MRNRSPTGREHLEVGDIVVSNGDEGVVDKLDANNGRAFVIWFTIDPTDRWVELCFLRRKTV